MQANTISRRTLLRRAAALAASTSIMAVAGCALTQQDPALPAVLRDQSPPDLQYPAAAPAPATPPLPGRLQALTAHEARTVEALTARILPGTPEDPGAREAGVVVYIDYLLSVNEGFAEPTYRQAPFAQVYTGDAPPDGADDPDAIWVSDQLIARYGFQAILTPREVYRIGIEAVDRYADARFNRDFADLSEDEQDSIITDMVEGRATGFSEVSAEQFFLVLRRHTAEGMFCDPAYGGNRNLVGWSLIGFPGAQRAYTPADMQNERFQRSPQAQVNLYPFNPGHESHDGAVLPLSGSDPGTWEDAHQHAPATPLPTPEG